MIGKAGKTVALYPILTAICVAAALCGICFGSVKISLHELLELLGGGSVDQVQIIVLKLRLPRTLAAGVAGVGLSLAGLLLQTVTGNGLCAPNIVGINAGAGLATMLMFCVFPAYWYLFPGAAFLGAVLTAAFVLAVASTGAGRLSKTTLVLAGVAISAVMNTGISFLNLRFPDAVFSYSDFSLGSFNGVGFQDIWLPAIVVAVAALLAMLIAPDLKLMLLGDDIAASLGCSVQRTRAAAVTLASALSAAVVSYAGLLSFVGLAVPHISRLIAGQDIRRNLFASGMLGFALVIAADTFGRIVFAPSELPAGMITAVIGAPFFIFLLLKRRYKI